MNKYFCSNKTLFSEAQVAIWSLYHTKYVLYSRVHISSDKAFCKILKKPSMVLNFFLPHMKAFSLAIEKKQKKIFFEKPNYQKPKIKNLNKSHFQGFTNIQFFILEQFLQFKACKSVKIDTIAIEVAQQIKSSGCPTDGLSYY